MNVHDGISEFTKSSPRRLRDAEELLEPPTLEPGAAGADVRHLRGAVYLCGYAVEGVLKAYLISLHSPITRLRAVRDRLRAIDATTPDICGVQGHNLNTLWRFAGLDARATPEVRAAFSTCQRWSSTWRYDPQPASYAEAKALVTSTRSFYDWVRTQF